MYTNRLGYAAMAEPATPTPASVDLHVVADRFNFEWATDPDSLEGQDTYWWWVVSVRVDPNEIIAEGDAGELWSIPFTTDGGDAITFGEPARVRQTFVPVAASAGQAATALVERRGQRVLAAALPRPTKPDRSNPAAASADEPHTEETTMDETVRTFLAAQGLDPDQATEDQINAASVFTAAGLLATPTPTPTVTPVVEAEPVGVLAPEPATAPTTVAVPVAASTAPPAGTVVVDEQRLAALEAAEATRREEDRNRVLASAMTEGRFAPSRHQHYLTAWQSDPDGTRVLLTASAADGGLAPNTVPVLERGANPAVTSTAHSLNRALSASGLPTTAPKGA